MLGLLTAVEIVFDRVFNRFQAERQEDTELGKERRDEIRVFMKVYSRIDFKINKRQVIRLPKDFISKS